MTVGSALTREFVVGMRGAFALSVVLCVIAALFSLVRGKEDRGSVTVPVPAEMNAAGADIDR